MLLKSLLILGGAGWVFGKVQYVGMNIAGFEFGCEIDGTCPLSSVQGPLSALENADGLGQMKHFVADDQMNIFRLPVSWQYLVNNKLGGTLDSTNFGKYDQLMQACLSIGTMCAIDIHNFARFNGQIIGQSSGGPTDAQFADLWTQLATKYKSNAKVIFGLMNEPHDLDVPTWANSVQAAVTAIRNAGAASQMILLPGTNFASAGQFVSSGSGDALIKVKNPDGSTDGLVLDLHKYLDVDNSGTHAECTTDNVADAFALAADFLRTNGRKALVSETGAGSTASCFTDFCAQNKFLNDNSDVFLGYIAWAAGSFATSYVLSLTPSKQNGKFVDNKLASQCVVAPWLNAGAVTFVSSAMAATSTTAKTASTELSSSATSIPTTSRQAAPNPGTSSPVLSNPASSTAATGIAVPTAGKTETTLAGTAASTSTGTKATIMPGSNQGSASMSVIARPSAPINQSGSGGVSGSPNGTSTLPIPTAGADMRKSAGRLLAVTLFAVIFL